MSDEAWQALVRRYADGRSICNCRDAYYTMIEDHVYDWRGGMRPGLGCEHGCSANQLIARDEIAKRVLAELLERTEGGNG